MRCETRIACCFGISLSPSSGSQLENLSGERRKKGTYAPRMRAMIAHLKEGIVSRASTDNRACSYRKRHHGSYSCQPADHGHVNLGITTTRMGDEEKRRFVSVSPQSRGEVNP